MRACLPFVCRTLLEAWGANAAAEPAQARSRAEVVFIVSCFEWDWTASKEWDGGGAERAKEESRKRKTRTITTLKFFARGRSRRTYTRSVFDSLDSTPLLTFFLTWKGINRRCVSFFWFLGGHLTSMRPASGAPYQNFGSLRCVICTKRFQPLSEVVHHIFVKSDHLPTRKIGPIAA